MRSQRNSSILPTNKGRVLGCVVLCLLVGASMSCDTPKRDVGGSETGKKEVTPKKAEVSSQPLDGKMRRIAVTEARIKQGKALYGGCAGCHGQEAEGRVGIAPRIASKSFLAASSDDFLVDTITKGREGTTMIPWGATYSQEQIESIVAYLRSKYPSEPITLNEAPLAGAADAGAKVFRNICSGCHGRTGGGYQETANGTGIGRRAFLDTASNGFLRYIVKHGKDQTAMRPFDKRAKTAVANLEDEEIENVIAHLRKNAW